MLWVIGGGGGGGGVWLELVSFHGLCNDKRMVRKMCFFLFLCGNLKFFLEKNIGACYLNGDYFLGV